MDISRVVSGSGRLTKERIEAMAAPASGSATLWDSEVKGFGIRVYATGSRAFFLNYRTEGRERRFTIGEYGTWSVDAARRRAKELRKEVDMGEDPAQQKRERRDAATVQDLIDRYLRDHLPNKTAKGRENDEKKMLAEIGSHLGKTRKVADVHHGDIASMHRAITESGRPIRANRILAIASKMFSMSLVPLKGENKPWRDAAAGNPCKGVARNPEEGRERFFGISELAAISEALAEYSGVGADCVRLIMLTGCRPSEAMLAQWSQFDSEPGFWVKPSAHTKQRKVHKLALAPPAIELLARLRKKRSGPWVFPGGKSDEPIKALWHVWHFVRDRAGLGADARIYDLRHTFASVGAAGGLGLPIIGRLLGHTQARTTQRYVHVGDDPVRQAAAKIGAVIANAGKGSDNVVEIDRKAR